MTPDTIELFFPVAQKVPKSPLVSGSCSGLSTACNAVPAQRILCGVQAEQRAQSEKREQLVASLATLTDDSQQGNSPGAIAHKAAAHQASAQAVLDKVGHPHPHVYLDLASS